MPETIAIRLPCPDLHDDDAGKIAALTAVFIAAARAAVGFSPIASPTVELPPELYYWARSKLYGAIESGVSVLEYVSRAYPHVKCEVMQPRRHRPD